MNDFWTIYWIAVAFIFGAVAGSFLNVCIWRMPRGESLVRPPSHCPGCGKRLRLWPDMVPLLSQLWYRSRCRHCGKHYSWRYFWVELITATGFAALTIRFGADPWDLYPALLWFSALVAIFFIDLENYVIPDALAYAAIAAGVAREVGPALFAGASLQQAVPGTGLELPVPLSLSGALLCFAGFWALAAFASALCGKEAMGAGDAFLAAALGAFLVPLQLVLVAVFLAVLLGTVVGLTRAAAARRETAEEPPQADAEPEEEPLPPLPAASRSGRLLAVLGVAGGGLAGWLLLRSIGPAGEAGSAWIWIAALGAAIALALAGARQWRAGDRQWAPAADAAFDAADDLGPRYVPFGPFLVAGGVIALLFGEAIIQWYLTVSGWEALSAAPAVLPPR